VQLDVTDAGAASQNARLQRFVGYHYLALRIANEVEPFRYRLRDGKVLVHDVIMCHDRLAFE